MRKEATPQDRIFVCTFLFSCHGDDHRRSCGERLHRYLRCKVTSSPFRPSACAVRQTSPEGIELTVASQLVGPFLFTGLLLPLLKVGAPSRVLWVSSGGMYSEPLSVERLEMSAADDHGVIAYTRAKRAQVTLAELWANRLASEGVRVHSMHPGWADTPGVVRSLPMFRRIVGPLLRTPAEGADTLVWLAVDEGAPLEKSGLFWLARRPRPLHRLSSTRRSDTPQERGRLWSWAMEKSGLLL